MSDLDIEVVSIGSELFDHAVKLYSSHKDKEWGVNDCISFIVMQDVEITDALTTDDHFRQAGLKALLIKYIGGRMWALVEVIEWKAFIGIAFLIRK